MALELECKILEKLAVFNGTSSRGPWAKQDFIVEYQDGQYTEKACLQVFGTDRVKELENYQTGDKVKVSLKIQAREYNGKWYNDIRVWKIARAGEGNTSDGYMSSRAPYSPEVPNYSAEDMPRDIGASTGFGVHEGQGIPAPGTEDDLPF
ncbi:MAG: DUF3127 domain-containing protein [Bacteroidales bacterium]|nr:DUF3127 domain-containing protein [Bacteroidales bacterium]